MRNKKDCQKELYLKLDPNNLRYPIKKNHSSTWGWVGGSRRGGGWREKETGQGDHSGGCCNSEDDEGAK